MTAVPVVLVAVLTYRRPELLAAMLPSVLDQAAALAVGSGTRAEVVVVDNDAEGSARGVVGAMAVGAPVPLHYVPEPEPGIVAGRNRALATADRLGAAALVFIDDDERPEPGWLEALIVHWHRSGAQLVAGPTVWEPGTALSPWVRASGFYERPRRPTGTVLPSAASGNLLLDVAAVRSAGLRFDARFALSGGEDTFFVRSFVATGGVVEWCDEAVAVETVPPERTTRGFVLARTFRRSSTWVRAVVLVEPRARRPVRRIDLLARAVVRLARGGAGWVLAAVRRDLPGRARSLCDVVSAAGMVVGLAGRTEREYRRT